MALPTVLEYESFIEKNVIGFALPKAQKYYENVTTIMKADFEKSVFFRKLNQELPRYNEEYLLSKKYVLFTKVQPVQIETKPFNSMINKCYRQDIINNPQWSKATFDWKDKDVWMNPLQCFERFSDILRTRISVRYLDGAVFILDKLKLLADSVTLSYEYDYKAEEEGYYAIHFDLIAPFEIPSLEFETCKIKSRVEIQINTEIQDLILALTHKYYEERRITSKVSSEKWQWDYECEEFLPNYLGHIIHYIEGMIMEVRKRQEEIIE
jgi:ppGpp synthetase/RelA/SpoT-type nucleotidyltranferase